MGTEERGSLAVFSGLHYLVVFNGLHYLAVFYALNSS